MMHDMSTAELQTYEALYKNQGARIMFRCDGVTYQGIVNQLLPGTCRVKLQHTKTVEGDTYYGNLTFKFREIVPFKIIESAEVLNSIPKNDYLQNILKNSEPVKNDVILKVLYGDKLSDESEDETPEEDPIEERLVLDFPKHLEHKLPKNYAVIDILDEDFYDAIRSISRQEAIGVSFHGPILTRFGEITLICISTDVYLFLFDVQKLGKEAFDKGLRQVFENQSVKKIIHDCRFPSDCLANLYATRLNNVFDTRVADYIVHMQQYNDKYEFHPFRTLDYCLRNYLNVPQDYLYEQEISETSSSKESVFTKRPISNGYLKDLLKSVAYLKLLHKELYKELFRPSHRATEFYRTVLAESDQVTINELGSKLSRPDRMIPSLLMNGIQTVRFEKPENQYKPLFCTFINRQNAEITRSTLGSSVPVKNDLTSSDKKNEISVLPNKESVVDKACSQLKNLKTEKVIRPYLGSPAAVRSAVLQSIEKKKRSLLAEKVNEVANLPASSNFKEIDKIYLPTFNSQMYPGRLDNIKNLKPIDHISKFSSRQRLSYCSDSNLSSFVNASSEKASSDFDASKSSNLSNKESDQSSDIWLKVRSEFLAEKANQPVHYKQRKISFVPG